MNHNRQQASGKGGTVLEKSALWMAATLSDKDIPSQTNRNGSSVMKLDKVLRLAKQKTKEGRLEEAKLIYQDILAKFPKNKRAQQSLVALNKPESSFVTQNPYKENTDQLISLYNQGKLLAVIELAELLTQQYPKAFDVWNLLGAAYKGLGRTLEASKAFKKVTELNPTYAEAYNNMGVVLRQQGELEAALEAYRKALSLKPDFAEVYYNMGTILNEQGHLDEAIKIYKKALSIRPDYVEAHYNMGAIFTEQHKLRAAIEAYNKAISIKPDYAAAHYNMGNTLTHQGEFAKATEAYIKAIEIKPNFTEAFNNLGIVLAEQNKLKDATAAYNKAISFKPDYLEVYHNLGKILEKQGKLDEAIATYNKAISIKPDYAEVYHNLGNILEKQGKLDEAIATYNKAVSIKPDYAEVYNNLGIALQSKGSQEKAIKAYNAAFTINPDFFSAFSSAAHLKAKTCNWRTVDCTPLDDYIALGLKNKIDHPIIPFQNLYTQDSPKNHLLLAKIFSSATTKNVAPYFFKKPAAKPKKIRVGYFSPDFRDHPVAQMIEGVLRHHDRNTFEIFAYSFVNKADHEMRYKIESAVDCFRDVELSGIYEVTSLARNDQIDIAIDLAGYTKNNRAEIFNQRVAPIQINYLGYPGTMGANFIDYIVADKVLIPKKMEQFYTENIIFMPDTYQPINDKLVISDIIPSKEELGLPNSAFVFCAVNQGYKIKPEEFSIWMRLLKKVEGSVLWLKSQNRGMELNLRSEASQRGVNPSRLVFAKRIPHEQYLAQFKQADLYLDTFNYNAGTTASDILRAGLPIVTKIGHSYASRMAASLLNNCNMNDLITNSAEDYESLSLELASKPDMLGHVKKRLQKNIKNSLIFDTALYTRNLEAAYKQAYNFHYSKKKPQNIEIFDNSSLYKKRQSL